MPQNPFRSPVSFPLTSPDLVLPDDVLVAGARPRVVAVVLLVIAAGLVLEGKDNNKMYTYYISEANVGKSTSFY